MTGRNPYLAPEEQEHVSDRLAGIVKGTEVVWNSVSGVAGLVMVAGNAAVNGMVGISRAMFGGAKAAANTPINIPEMMGDAGDYLFQGMAFGKLMGGAVFALRGLQAIGEFSQGDVTGGVSKLVRGAVEGAVVMLNISGLPIFFEIASKLVTGKFLSTHAGDFAEDATRKIAAMFSKDENRQELDNVQTAQYPGAVAVLPGGVAAAGLTTNYFMPQGANAPLVFGAPPPSEMMYMPQGAQVLPHQVMPAMYPQERAQGMDAATAAHAYPAQGVPQNYWQNMIAQQSGRGVGQQPVVQSNDERFGQVSHADAVMFARQQAALAGAQPGVA